MEYGSSIRTASHALIAMFDVKEDLVGYPRTFCCLRGLRAY